MNRKRPILWEEDERYQRGGAWVLSIAFALFVATSAGLSIWRKDWTGLWWLGQIVAGVASAVLVWSALIWVIARAFAAVAVVAGRIARRQA